MKIKQQYYFEFWHDMKTIYFVPSNRPCSRIAINQKLLMQCVFTILLMIGIGRQTAYAQSAGAICEAYNFNAAGSATNPDDGTFAALIESPEKMGLVQSRWFGWSGGTPGTLTVAANGMSMTLTGKIENIEESGFRGTFPGDANLKFDVEINFVLAYPTARAYLAAQGYTTDPEIDANIADWIKFPWQYKAEVIANIDNIQIWDFDPNNPSTLTSCGTLCNGDVITLNRRMDAVGMNYLVQTGPYGNDKNSEIGLGTWIEQTGTLCGTALPGTGADTRATHKGDFNIDIACTGIAPVELIAFDAEPRTSDVKLEWSTATEVNNEQFIIERSLNGVFFETLTSLRGQGTTETVTNYEAIDTRPLRGTSYYRLKQVDFDGTSAYSHVVEINFDPAANGLSVYPNPLAQDNFINLDMNNWQPETVVSISVLDITGRQLAQTREVTDGAGNLKTQLDLDLTPGTYVIKAQAGDDFRSGSFVKR